MELTAKQSAGLKITLDRYFSGERYATISGYAGTGKSTLVKFIIDAIDIEPEYVVYAAYTGKAAEVLRKKGNTNAMTLHKLLYESIPKPTGGFFRKIKSNLLPYKIVVVDEVSMVPKTMIDLLMRHKIFIIFLGDPFQLPQIERGEEHTILEHPHVFLDEVMRQAQESEIIRLTMDIRAGKTIKPQVGKETYVIAQKDFNIDHLIWADQVICATNPQRLKFNQQMREYYGFSGPVQDGEKVICLRNYWDDLSDDGLASLVNGMTGFVKNCFQSFIVIPKMIKVPNHIINVYCADFYSDGDNKKFSICMDKNMMDEENFSLEWKIQYQLCQRQMFDVIPKEFTYGYAITAWKAQGSEFPKVTVYEQSFPPQKEEHARYLYTACTRASEKLVLVLQN